VKCALSGRIHDVPSGPNRLRSGPPSRSSFRDKTETKHEDNDRARASAPARVYIRRLYFMFLGINILKEI
jgi:hypothetical protein